MRVSFSVVTLCWSPHHIELATYVQVNFTSRKDLGSFLPSKNGETRCDITTLMCQTF